MLALLLTNSPHRELTGLCRHTAEEADVMRRVMNFLGEELRCVSYLVFTHCEGIPFAEHRAHLENEVQTDDGLKKVAEFCEGKVLGCGTIGLEFNPMFKTAALVENVKCYQRSMRDVVPCMGDGFSVSLTQFQQLEEEAKVEYIRARILGQNAEHVNLLVPVKEDLDQMLALIKERERTNCSERAQQRRDGLGDELRRANELAKKTLEAEAQAYAQKQLQLMEEKAERERQKCEAMLQRERAQKVEMLTEELEKMPEVDQLFHPWTNGKQHLPALPNNVSG